MSGMTRNRILLPRMYACSSWFTRPSLPVCVMPSSWQFQLSSDSRSVPRYVSPFLSSICDGDATRATTGGAGWVDERVRREGGRKDRASIAPNEDEERIGFFPPRRRAIASAGKRRRRARATARARRRRARPRVEDAIEKRTHRHRVPLGFVQEFHRDPDPFAESARHGASVVRSRRGFAN